ncbi:hypothetical protein D3C81_1129370 [compost metagenome]
MGQLTVVAVHLGNRQLAPVGLQVFTPALEFALPAVAHGQAGGRVEQQFAQVFQCRQLAQLAALHFVGAVLGDGGEAWVDVFHPAIAVDQQEGAGALLHRTLEQVQCAGRRAPVVVGDDLGELVGQLAGKGDFVRLPGPWLAGLLQAQHADYLAIDADTGVEHGLVFRAQALCQGAGARVVAGVVGVDGAAGVQRVEVVGKAAGIDGFGLAVFLRLPVPGGDRLQALVLQVPDAGTVDLVDLAGTLGNQLGGFQQRVAGAVALARQAQDQVLLAAYPLQVLELFLLRALVQLQRQLQAVVARFQVAGAGLVGLFGLVVEHAQVAAQQLAVVLLVGFAGLQQAQRRAGGVQGIAHAVVATLGQLLLDLVVQPVAGFGFHQAGVGRVYQGAQVTGLQAELAFAGRVQVEHGPGGFVEPFETQHAEPRGHG